MSIFLDELNTSTRRKIVPGLTDNFGKNDPLLAYMKKNNIETFEGGSLIQENTLYSYLPGGGATSAGSTYPVILAQLETGLQFQPKEYVVPVSIGKELVQVFNKGPEAVFRIIDSRLQAAALTMSAILAVAIYNEGQSAGRTLQLNGLDEQLNDGTNNGYNAQTYTTYGQVARNGTVGAALNSPMTGPAANVAGPITYKILEEAYNSVVIGDERPNLMVTTNKGLSYIKEKFQPQWRTESTDPEIGFVGLKFNGSMVMQSQYAPGTAGVNDPLIGNYLASAGETLWFLNTKYIRFYLTNDPEFGFGFTGFKPAQDSLVVSGQYCFMGNVTNQAPRLGRELFGITG